MTQPQYQAALAAFDQANSEDPNRERVDGKEYPKELLYAQRMSKMLARFAPGSSEPVSSEPGSSEAVQLAVRAQHIQRWKIPRSNYPMDRIGYLQWRTTLYKFHAETAGNIMRAVGYDTEMIARVRAAISKKALKANPEAQLMEDIANLVFIEHYMAAFAGQHPEYDEAKWIEIIQKIWKKMSPHAREFALAGNIKLPETLVPLILKALGF